ncbi:MAG TPA: M28 family peptidase [Sphingomicrobium sp.]|nr:M28 family peptidase [Sphingomicrobium sp.]
MRSLMLLPLLALAVGSAHAQPAAPSPDERLRQIAQPVSGAQMKRTIDKLVSFGTRHTLSSQTDPKRGIGAALNWTEAELRRYSRACRGCLEVGRASQVMEGRRLTGPTRITNVFALQRGTERPNDVIIITGHIDSRVTDVMDATSDAPGANDDGSGTAAVIEAARVLSKHKFPATIVYAALSGEEQGLYGGKVMADYAKAQGWNVIANLNNDIIGNSCGSDGVCNDRQVRVFSEGSRWQGREELAAQQRSRGGENDSPSRNLSRFLDSLADRLNIGLDVLPIWRTDRFGRGGDHIEMLNAGFPAVRLTEAVENYRYQHQDLRVENGVEYGDTVDKMDFAYLEKVTKFNVAALAALASAPPPPEPTVEGAVSTDTTVSWYAVSAGADSYMIRWRRTDAANWQNSKPVSRYRPGIVLQSFEEILPHIRVDDWVFGVSSVSKDGFESPVASAVPGGAFKPYVAPPPTSP